MPFSAKPLPAPVLCDALPIGVCVLDESLLVYAWNQTLEGWTGIASDEAVGRRLDEVVPEIVGSNELRRVRSALAQQAPVVLSALIHKHFLPIRSPSGELMPQRTCVQPCSGNGLAVVSIEDHSQPMSQLQTLRAERRRLADSKASLEQQSHQLEAANAELVAANRQAEDANRAKSEFLANMSHEVRTPLSAILGFAEVLSDDPTPAARQDAVETIRRNGQQLLSLVNDILDLSRVEASQLNVRIEPCSPAKIAREVADSLTPAAAAKGLWLRVEGAECVPDAVASDPVRLCQVLTNLINNAVKFTDTGGVTLAMSERPDGGVEFAVIDTGIGISADELGAVFQPFHQVDSAADRRRGGAGLGLAICRSLVETLDGSLTAESSPGVGSTFRLRLPRRPAASASAGAEPKPEFKQPATAPAPALTAGDLAGVSLLVAEDGVDNRRLIEYFLGRVGADLEFVTDGQQAVDRMMDASKPQPQAVLMDMQMPVMDGYTATRRLRELGRQLPVIALTAHAMQGDREKALAAGCSAYATKPIDAAKLVATIRGLLPAEAPAG